MSEQVFEVRVTGMADAAAGQGREAGVDAATRRQHLIKEHETLVRHFEEIYRTGATTFSVAAAGSGAMVAYFGPNWQTGQVSMAVVPLVMWYFGVVVASYRYTLSVRKRLAEIEGELASSGHFKSWHADQKRRYIGADWNIHLIMLFVIVAASVFPFVVRYIHDGSPTPVEVVVERKDGASGFQVKYSSEPDVATLKKWRDKLKALDGPVDTITK